MPVVAGFRAVVRGRVQGVSFRQFVLGKARCLGLKGYVCNLPDGRSVEVAAEGERNGLEGLLRELHQGPRGAVVEQVELRWMEQSEDFEDFRVVHRMPAG